MTSPRIKEAPVSASLGVHSCPDLVITAAHGYHVLAVNAHIDQASANGELGYKHGPINSQPAKLCCIRPLGNSLP